MVRIILYFVGLTWVSVAALPALSQAPSQAASSHRALLNQYCVTCHNERLRTAELTLDTADVDNISRNTEVWEKVVRKLRASAMPPAGMPRPAPAAYEAFATYLETELDRAAATNPDPGATGTRRLNRTEYANAIRDLLALEIAGESLLPADDSRHGFDNIGDVLTISPLLSERYLSAARRISRLAVGDSSLGSAVETYEVPKYLYQDTQMSPDLPFGTRGGVAIRHNFPLDGEYEVQVRLHRNHREFIRGLAEPHQLDVRLDGATVHRFTVGGEIKGKSAPVFSTAAQGDIPQELYERSADDALNVRFQAQAGSRLVGVAFLDEALVTEGPLQQRMTQYDFTQYKGGKPAVASVTISGPYDAKGAGETPSRQRVFICTPSGRSEEEPCARKILSTLARRAYRRPVTDPDVETLMSLYREGRERGSFETGIETAMERILAGPEFLFHVERNAPNVAPGKAHRISDLELASRLSFFLWSSIPDEELLSAAENGKLHEPAVFEQQIRRMLADSRSEALVKNFAGQWLYLRNLRSISPDPEVFPYFDDNLREAFRQETELFFESMLREDRSVLDLLDADYTFVNERLARHYGIPNVYGSHFRRVTVNDENRRGLLGQGSVLTVTSYANRTSPVTRGKWVLENILGTPPPPPPPDVPALRERSEGGKTLSIRQAMEQHRANPVCAACHRVMDPLGFALENFDGIGRWRTIDAKAPIDSSGQLPDGTPFQGLAGLRKVLREKRSEQFVLTATERHLTYALGRGVESSDAPAIRKIMREAKPSNYRWSSLILGVARSMQFQMRKAQ
jgi:mono/diheme cytochrome c family protein